MISTGNYQLDTEDESLRQRDKSTTDGYNYYIDTTKSHQIKITRFDLDNKIISGEFEFTCVNDDLQDTIKVTEGRFDLNDIIIQP